MNKTIKKNKKMNKTIKALKKKQRKIKFNKRKSIKKKHIKKHNTTKKKGGVNWKKGLVSALVLGGPAAAVNFGSPQFGSVGTQFGQSVERLQTNDTSAISFSKDLANTSGSTIDKQNISDLTNYDSFASPTYIDNWNDTNYTRYTDIGNWSNTAVLSKNNAQEWGLDSFDETEKLGEGGAHTVYNVPKKSFYLFPDVDPSNIVIRVERPTIDQIVYEPPNKVDKLASDYSFGPKIYDKSGLPKTWDNRNYEIMEMLKPIELKDLDTNFIRKFGALMDNALKHNVKPGDTHLGNLMFRGDNLVWSDTDRGDIINNKTKQELLKKNKNDNLFLLSNKNEVKDTINRNSIIKYLEKNKTINPKLLEKLKNINSKTKLDGVSGNSRYNIKFKRELKKLSPDIQRHLKTILI